MSIREELIKAIEAIGPEDLEELLEYARWVRSDSVCKFSSGSYRLPVYCSRLLLSASLPLF